MNAYIDETEGGFSRGFVPSGRTQSFAMTYLYLQFALLRVRPGTRNGNSLSGRC
jgi:hypothetical protein